MKRIFISTIFIVFVKVLFAQDYDSKYNTRTVLITTPDSVINAKILNSQKEFKINDELKYYWYADEKIGYNRGGINGSALHGTYTVFDSENKLMTQGEFKNGLKEGKWKRWYPNGELKSVENYKHGLKNDIQIYYNKNGDIEKEIMFKNGIEVEDNDKSFFKSIFTKKEKEQPVNDSTQTNKKIVQESDI